MSGEAGLRGRRVDHATGSLDSAVRAAHPNGPNPACEAGLWRALAAVSAAPMFNDLSSTLALLETRRSGKPRELVAPGPSADELSGS